MADVDVVQHPNPDLPAAPNAPKDEPAPADQLQRPAGQATAVLVVNQRELEVIIFVPNCHDLRSLLFFLLETVNRFG